MEQKIHNGSRWALIIVSSVIVLTAVFLGGLFWGQKSSESAYQQGYVAAWSAAKLAIDESGFFPPEFEEIFDMAGEIMDINVKNHTLTMMAEPISDNPLAETGPAIRTIQISVDTVLSKKIPKDFEEYFAEQEAYDAQFAELGPDDPEVGQPPFPFTSEDAVFEDFEVGQIIVVHTSIDIKEAEQINPEYVDLIIEDGLADDEVIEDIAEETEE
jgi:hypothetical protein